MDKGNLCAILANRFFCGQLSLFFFALFGMAGGRVVRAESERAVERAAVPLRTSYSSSSPPQPPYRSNL